MRPEQIRNSLEPSAIEAERIVPETQAEDLVQRLFPPAIVPYVGECRGRYATRMTGKIIKIHEAYFDDPEKARAFGKKPSTLRLERTYAAAYGKGADLKELATMLRKDVNSLKQYVSRFLVDFRKMYGRDEARLKACYDQLWAQIPRISIEQAAKLAGIAVREMRADIPFSDENDSRFLKPACKDAPDLFFPEVGEDDSEAKRLCSSCPLMSGCLAMSLANDEEFGIWGGLNEAEREALLDRSVSLAVVPDA